jgi:hypothetical protein
VSMMGAGLRPSGKPGDLPPYPKMRARRISIPTICAVLFGSSGRRPRPLELRWRVESVQRCVKPLRGGADGAQKWAGCGPIPTRPRRWSARAKRKMVKSAYYSRFPKINKARDGYVAFALCTPTSILPASGNGNAVLGRYRSGRGL